MSRKKTMAIACIIVLALSFCVGIYVSKTYQKKEETFNTAVQLFGAGKYTEAEEAFKQLKTFRDSRNLVVISDVFNHLREGNYDIASQLAGYIKDYSSSDKELQKAIDVVRAKYYDTAQSFASEGNYEEASMIYRCLGDYKDASRAAIYYEAIQEEDRGNIKEAVRLFDKIKNYKDASVQQDLCNTYLKAVELQEKGDDKSLEQATKLFRQLQDYKDSKILKQYSTKSDKGWKKLLKECKNRITYIKAQKKYKAEHFYKARRIFKKLGNFKDSKEMAEKCKRVLPAQNILYQNPDYESSSVNLTINNPGSKNSYIKLYTSKKELIARIFIRSGQTASINLPSGTYRINCAYGDDWYDKDMFGDKGSYLKCMSGGSEDFTFKDGQKYTLEPEGDNSAVTGVSVDFDDF